jgi:hypothetical protein
VADFASFRDSLQSAAIVGGYLFPLWVFAIVLIGVALIGFVGRYIHSLLSVASRSVVQASSVIEHVELQNEGTETLSVKKILGKHVYLNVALPCHSQCVVTHLLKAVIHLFFVADVFLGCALLMDPKSTIAIQVCGFVGAASGTLIDFLVELILMRLRTTKFTTDLIEGRAPSVGDGFSLSVGVGELRRQIYDEFVVACDEDEPVPRCVNLDTFVDDVNSIEDHAWVDAADVIVDDGNECSAGSTVQDESSVSNGFEAIEYVVVHHVEVPFLQNTVILLVALAALATILLIESIKRSLHSTPLTSGIQWCLFFWDLLLVQSLAILVHYTGYFILEMPLHNHPHAGQFMELGTRSGAHSL